MDKDEKQYYDEFLRMFPYEFNGLSHFEKLCKMRHYQSNNRVLDITSNPLISLYFACQYNWNIDGAVFIYKVKTDEILDIYSDRAMILSCLPCLSKEDRNEIKTISLQFSKKKSFPSFIYNHPSMIHLLHEIKREMPAFENNIVPSDLLTPFYVSSSANTNRVINQKGSFIIYGLSDYKDANERLNYEKLVIDRNSKKRILKELSILGIDQSFVYPDIEHKSAVIMNKVLDLKNLGE